MLVSTRIRALSLGVFRASGSLDAVEPSFKHDAGTAQQPPGREIMAQTPANDRRLAPIRRATPRGFLLTLLLVLAACSIPPTPFQPASGRDEDGYTVTQLEANRFRLGFSGNLATPHQTVDDNLLYLAAQVTLHNGADWFLISRASADKDTTYPTFATPPTFVAAGGWIAPVGGTVTTDFNNPQTSWSETATILLAHGRKPAGDANAYDARDLASHLAPLIKRGQVPGPY